MVADIGIPMFSFLSFRSQISESKHLENTVFLHIESTQFSFSRYHRLGEAIAGREEGFPGCSDESQGWPGPLLAQGDWNTSTISDRH